MTGLPKRGAAVQDGYADPEFSALAAEVRRVEVRRHEALPRQLDTNAASFRRGFGDDLHSSFARTSKPITRRMGASLASDNKREPRATRQRRIRALGATGRVAEAASYQHELAAHRMHRPARTFVLPVPPSRMLAAYTLIGESEPNFGTEILISVTNPIESVFATVRHRTGKTKGCLSRKTGLAMACRRMMSAQEKWRKLDGANQLPEIFQGIVFKDGIKQVQTAA